MKTQIETQPQADKLYQDGAVSQNDKVAPPGPLPGAEYDLRPLHREYAMEALDGALWQAQGACRALERTDDKTAFNAIERARHFFGEARKSIHFCIAEAEREKGGVA